MKLIPFSILLILLYSCGSGDATIDRPIETKQVPVDGEVPDINHAPSNKYQIGDRWTRSELTKKFFKNNFFSSAENSIIKKAGQAIAKYEAGISYATAYYLGKHNENYIIATNYHAFLSNRNCSANSIFSPWINFSFIKRKFKCSEVIALLPKVDLAILSIRVRYVDRALINKIKPFRFEVSSIFQQSQPVFTLGFGKFKNKKSKLTLAHDRHCKIFSQSGQVNYIKNPNQTRFASKNIWSFVTGCDVSPGDSGSPVIDRKTGNMLGVIWGTSSPKPLIVMSPNYLNELIANNDARIFSQLSYAVPSYTIIKSLNSWLLNTKAHPRKRSIVYSIINAAN